MAEPKAQRDFSTKLENLRNILSEMFTSIQTTHSNIRSTTWTPIFSAIVDGERRVLKIVDWVGGTSQSSGNKPPINTYLGPEGLTSHLSEAVDFRGMPGPFIDTPEAFGIPYETGERIGDRNVMACRVWCGTLPDNASKSVALPQVVLDDIEKENAWIDIGSSYAFNPTNNFNWPLTAAAWGSDVDNSLQHRVTVGLNDDDILLRTNGNLFPETGGSWAEFTRTIVVVKYLKQLPA